LTKNHVFLPAIALGAAMLSQAQTAASSQTAPPTKVGIIAFQNAIISTKDGQKAAADLTTRFAPKKSELEKKQSTIAQLQDQLRKGTNTMSEEAKQKLMREIDQNTKSLNRETEDAQAELDQEQNKIMQELGQRIVAVIDKYAKENGYTLIMDVSSRRRSSRCTTRMRRRLPRAPSRPRLRLPRRPSPPRRPSRNMQARRALASGKLKQRVP